MTLAGPFNTVTLVANTPLELVPPGGGVHCTYTIYNTGPGKLYVSNLNTAGANATSFVLPAAAPLMSFAVTGRSFWVASDQAGAISVAVVPR